MGKKYKGLGNALRRRLLMFCFGMALFIPSGSPLFAQDDTVGFWKITENGKEISPVTLNGEPCYLLETLSDSALMCIYYYTESPCAKCMCKLQVRDTNGAVLNTIERKGYGNNVPFSFPGKNLKGWLSGRNGRFYLYFSGRYDGWMPWVFLGEVKSGATQ